MPSVIYKYPLAPAAPAVVEHMIPRGATLLSVGLDPHGVLCLWALVDPEHTKMRRKFLTVGTGQNTPLLDTIIHVGFVGSVLQPPFVWHIFEVSV